MQLLALAPQCLESGFGFQESYAGPAPCKIITLTSNLNQVFDGWELQYNSLSEWDFCVNFPLPQSLASCSSQQNEVEWNMGSYSLHRSYADGKDTQVIMDDHFSLSLSLAWFILAFRAVLGSNNTCKHLMKGKLPLSNKCYVWRVWKKIKKKRSWPN